MKRIITILLDFLKLKEPDFPDEYSYEGITTYLIGKQNVSIQYYRYVMGIGIVGILISVSFVLVTYFKTQNNPEQIDYLKQYPSILFSFVTIAFSQIEIEYQKQALYKKLDEVAKINLSNDPETIKNEYKKWVWQEFQDKFKTQEL